MVQVWKLLSYVYLHLININMGYNSTQARFTQIIGYTALVVLWVFAPWPWIIASLIYYKLIVGLLGNQIAQHRYFSHRSFNAVNYKHQFLAWISLTTGISPIIYASIHRHHHRYSDTDKDIHSPKHGLVHSIFAWSWNKNYNVKPAVDLMRDSLLVNLHNNLYKYLFIASLILCLIDWRLTVYIFLAGIGWNYLHMGLIRSALVHIKLPGSYQNYDAKDHSYNNKYLQVVDIGEGLHNNHHAYPNKSNQACLPGEFDPAGWIVDKFFKRQI